MSEGFEILLVDDDRTAVTMLGRLLSEFGRLRFATSGPDALKLALESVPDLVVLDIEMPGMDGFEVCKAMKAIPVLAEVPIIFLTSREGTEQEVTGLSLGAVDFITKPPSPALVKARVRTHLRLKHMTDELRRAATIDGLTGVPNRRQFDERLTREWLRAQRMRLPLALLMIDIDCFKQYNDHYGHQAGDQCLRSVAQAVMRCARRPGDLVARYGGEEFALLLPETDARGARTLAEQLLCEVAALHIPHARSPVAAHVTISVGAAACDETCLNWMAGRSEPRATQNDARPPGAALVTAADRALYAAKQSGRGRACFALIDTASNEFSPQPSWS